MSVFNRIISSLSRTFGTSEKAAKLEFNVSNIPEYTEYSSLLGSTEYLSQYVGWTKRSIEVIADAVITFEPKLYSEDSKGKVQEIDSTFQLLKDLRRFNGFMSLGAARKLRVIQQRLSGSAYWLIRPANVPGHVYEFYPLDPERVGVKVGRDGLPLYYIYRDMQGKEVRIEPSDIIVFNKTNPKSPIRGYSDVEAARYPHNTYELISKSNMNTFGNNGIPKGIVSIKGIDDIERDRLERKFERKFGGVENAGKTAISNQEVTFTPMGQTLKDLDYVSGMTMVRDEILAMMGVPKPLVGLTDSTYNNMKEAQRVFQTVTLRPELRMEEDVLNEQLIPKYLSTDRFSDEIFFKFDNPVEIDFASDSTAITQLYEKKLIDRFIALERLGFVPTDADRGVYYEADSFFDNPINQLDVSPDVEPAKPEKSGAQIIINNIPSVNKSLHEAKEMNRVDLKAFVETEILGQELILNGEVAKYWDSQAERFVRDYLAETEIKSLDGKDEIGIAVEFFKHVYKSQSQHWKLLANEFISSNHDLSPTAERTLDQQLKRFATEINETTLKDVKKVIKDAVENDYSSRQTANSILQLFNGYIEGEGNIDKLKELGVYIERSEITQSGSVILGSTNRYNRMLESITKTLTGEQQKEGLRALLGAIPEGDALGESISGLLRNLYHIEEIEGITRARAETIARTETNKLKNEVLRDVYAQDESVEAFEWLSAHDARTREAHARADGNIAPKGMKFRVGGEYLKYPGDPSGSAENVINCRCTVLPVVKRNI